MEEPYEQEHGYLYSLGTQGHSTPFFKKSKRYFANLSLSAAGQTFKLVKFQIDTAASCNTISVGTLHSFFPDAEVNRSPYHLHPYENSKPLHPVGQVELLCKKNNKFDTLIFQVLPDSCIGIKPVLLSGSDSERLGLIKVQADEIHSLHSSADHKAHTKHYNLPGFQLTTQACASPPQYTAPSHTQMTPKTCNHLQQLHDTTVSPCNPLPSLSAPITVSSTCRLPPLGQLQIHDILVQSADTFEGLGLLGPPVHFQIDDSVQPIQMPVHRIPVAKRTKEKDTLDCYVQAGVLVKVNEPTPWCSNKLIRETPKKFRVCIDPSQTVNKAIQRLKHQMPTLNEQLHNLSTAKCFSLVDVKEGFLHIPLDEESSWMTMHTSYGRYRCLCHPFGITSPQDEFQMRLTASLEGLDGMICIADDILVYGEGHTFEDAQVDHDRRFIALIECCIQRSIKLNASKLRFKLKEVKFMGTIISDNGLKADPDKIAAITQMATPQNKPSLTSLLHRNGQLSVALLPQPKLRDSTPVHVDSNCHTIFMVQHSGRSLQQDQTTDFIYPNPSLL